MEVDIARTARKEEMRKKTCITMRRIIWANYQNGKKYKK